MANMDRDPNDPRGVHYEEDEAVGDVTDYEEVYTFERKFPTDGLKGGSPHRAFRLPEKRLEFPESMVPKKTYTRDSRDFPIHIDFNKPLPYAKDLTDCVPHGKKKAGGGCGNCAKAVRHTLMCMMKKRGNDATVHCGPGAYAYYGHGCLEDLDFRLEDRACDTPGAIRVYYGQGRNNYKNCKRYQKGKYCGHIEVVGTDERFHAHCSDDVPRNESAPNTRFLKGCYIYQGKGWDKL